MVILKARFDGERVILPDDVQGAAPGEVILIFEEARERMAERHDWLKAQEPAFAKAWENDDDAIYDTL